MNIKTKYNIGDYIKLKDGRIIHIDEIYVYITNNQWYEEYHDFSRKIYDYNLQVDKLETFPEEDVICKVSITNIQ